MSILYFLLVAWVFYLLQVILYNKYWNEKLSVEVSFKDSEIFEGESTELIEDLRNNKWIPIWWLSLQVSVSRYLIFSGEVQLKPRNNEFTRKYFPAEICLAATDLLKIEAVMVLFVFIQD